MAAGVLLGMERSTQLMKRNKQAQILRSSLKFKRGICDGAHEFITWIITRDCEVDCVEHKRKKKLWDYCAPKIK